MRRELYDTAEHLLVGEDTLEQVIDLGRRRRRLRWTRTAAATAAAAVVVAGVAALRPPENSPVSSGPSTTAGQLGTTAAAPSTAPALLLAGPDHLRIVYFDGTEMAISSDANYEAIAAAVPDGAGGILFQHEVTPLPWDQGSVLRLRPGTNSPEVVLAPVPGNRVRPLTAVDGHLLVRIDHDNLSEVMALELRTGASHLVIPPTGDLVSVAASGDRVVAALGGDCPRLAWYDLSGRPLPDPSWAAGACWPGTINDLALSAANLYTLEDTDQRFLVQRDLASGVPVAVPAGGAWGLSVLPDGTVGLGGTEVRVGRIVGAALVESVRAAGFTGFSLGEVAQFPAGASLGSGAGTLPCQPSGDDPIPQDLPAAVGDRRLQLFDMAAACELTGLADAARADGTLFNFGGETDPLRSWVRSARNGFDVPHWMVRMFNTDPAVDAAGTHVWPAVHVTNADEDWAALADAVTPAEFGEYDRSQGSGWLGLRIGIGGDGSWRFAVAGD